MGRKVQMLTKKDLNALPPLKDYVLRLEREEITVKGLIAELGFDKAREVICLWWHSS